MIAAWLTHPLVALALFAGLAAGLYALGGRLAERGEDAPGKHLPYACGEDFITEEARLSYGRFFRLALMFVVVHMATLVMALLPRALDTRLLATGYLLGLAVCVDVLVQGEN